MTHDSTEAVLVAAVMGSAGGGYLHVLLLWTGQKFLVDYIEPQDDGPSALIQRGCSYVLSNGHDKHSS